MEEKEHLSHLRDWQGNQFARAQRTHQRAGTEARCASLPQELQESPQAWKPRVLVPCPRLLGKPPRAIAICSSMMTSGTLPKTTQGTTDIWKWFRLNMVLLCEMNNMPAMDLWGSLLAKLWLLLDTVQTAIVMERQVSICLELTLIPRLRVKRETMWYAKTCWPNSLITGCFQLFDSALLCASHGFFLHTSLFSSFLPRKRSYLDFLSSVMISYLFINAHPWNKSMGMMVSAMHSNSWPRVCAAASGV